MPRGTSHLHRWCITLLLSTLLIGAATAAPTPLSGSTLTAAIPRHFPPHYAIGATGNPEGFSIDVLEELARRGGFELRYRVEESWPAAIEALHAGRADLIPDLGITPARQQDFAFTSPITTLPVNLFLRDDARALEDPTDLTGLRIVTVAGNVAVSLLGGRSDLNLLVEETVDTALFTLLAGEADALVYPAPVVWWAADRAGVADHIKTSGPPLLEIKRALAVRQDRRELLATLNPLVEELVRSDDYRRIYQRWYGAKAGGWLLSWKELGWLLALAAVTALLLAWRFISITKLNHRMQQNLLHLSEAQSELQVSQRRLAEAQRMAKIGNWELDLAKNELWWSDEIYHIFGMDPHRFAATYEAFLSTIHPDDRERVNEAYTAAVKNKVPYELVHRILTPAGEVKYVHEHSREVKDEQGKVLRSTGTVQDVTELMLVQQELQRYQHHLEDLVAERTAELEQAKERAEAANRAKSTFLANMSHELRTPLSAVLGFSKLMAEDPATPEPHRDYLGIINRAGEHLLGLINDVLDMSKIEAGRVAVEPEPLDLQILLQDLAEMMRNRAEARNLAFALELPADLPRYIKADRSKLRQILINLVGNAVKYTEQGGVTLRLRCEKTDSGSLRLYAEIEDTGIGIAADQQEQIFEPFVQLGQHSTVKGTGLGLAITREYLQLMGGEIGVESVAGRGSLFHFSLPVEPASAEEMQLANHLPGPVAGLEPGQPTYRILVVDDVRETRLLLRRLLEPIGFLVREAENGLDAVEQVRNWHPHLVWMDWRMPVMDGLEATRRIKSMEGRRDTVVIALTASVFREQRDQLLASGCDDFLRKPFRVEEVFEVMARHLNLRYVYAAHKPGLAPGRVVALTPASLALLPASLKQELHQAALECDGERLQQVAEKVGEHAPELVDVLTTLIHEFRYPDIQQLTEPPPQPGTGIQP